VLSFYGVSGQNIYADSDRRELEKVSKEDTNKARILSQLAYDLRYSNMDSSQYYGEIALSLAQKLKYPLGEARALSDLGIVFREKGELPRSLELELRALAIAEKYGFLIIKSNSLRRIGLVYLDLSALGKTIDYCKKALDFDQQIEYNRGKAYDYLVSCMAYIERKHPDSAWYFLNKSGELVSYIKDYMPDFLLWRGEAYLLKGNKDSALANWKEGLQMGFSMHYYRAVSMIYYYMGTMYRQMNRPDSSIIYAKKGLEFAEKASNRKNILLSSRLLFELYDPLNPAEALYYLRIASAAQDVLLGPGIVQTIDDLIAHDNERQMEIQAERAIEKASYQNRLRQIMLATGLGALLIIASILYYNNRKKQMTNITLAQQKAEIQDTLNKLKSTQSQLVQAEKMASLGELTAGIAHEIQNPLNFVNNFSDVNAELLTEMREQLEKGNLEEAKRISGDIEANEHKISHHGRRADGIVKNMVLHARGSVGQKESTHINSLADEYLRLTYHAIRAKDKSFHAELNTAFDDTIGKIEIIPQDIGRVLVNLYNNSFYAVKEKAQQSPNGYEPQVSVTTKKTNGMVQITVKDNGNGIPENIRQKIFQPFFTTKPTGQGTGLGLSLAYDIIKAHGGEIQVETKEGEGSEFIVTIGK
jgi:signal transduction histidine kinase